MRVMDWAAIPQQTMQDLVDSFPNRVRARLHAEGGTPGFDSIGRTVETFLLAVSIVTSSSYWRRVHYDQRETESTAGVIV